MLHMYLLRFNYILLGVRSGLILFFCYGLAKMFKCSGEVTCKNIYIFFTYCLLTDFLAWG